MADNVTRRDFLKASALAAGAVTLAAPAARLAFGQGSDKLRIGLIGCGGRGTDAVRNCFEAAKGSVEITAVADLFEGQAKGAMNGFKNLGADCKITPETCFSGFDCHEKLVKAPIDLVITAAPPGFRPMHFKAAIEAGKHVFFEKPVGVDPPGCRSVMELGKLAKEKKLSVVAGTQRRHQGNYIETMKKIHDGAIGDLVAGYAYWNGGGIWYKQARKEWSELEWQCHNWYHWDWLSGDHICEQHVHNIDVIFWAFKNQPPEKIMGMGGRQNRDHVADQVKAAKEAAKLYSGDEANWPKFNGNIYDHFAVEFEWPGGIRVLSECRHAPRCTDRVNERVVGTKGTSSCCDMGGGGINPYVQEHVDLLASIRGTGPYLNEAEQVANSTLAAVGGRMSAYTGRELSWKWLLTSKLEIFPKELKPGPGIFPAVAIPGEAPLV